MKFVVAIFILVVTTPLRAAELIEPPLPPSPIAEFRGWLKQSPEERKVALAKRSDKSRAALEKKIQEYQVLPAIERERRLAASEMQWYLSRLLSLPKAQRDNVLKTVPLLWQPMILERLDQWDKLSPQVRAQALTHKLVVDYLATPAHQQETVLRSLAPAERDTLVQRVAQWKILPAIERARMDERLNDFLDFQREKQARTLNGFTPAERDLMLQTLDSFRKLSPAQRDMCIKSFAQFAKQFGAMDRANQVAFLKNVERWQEMSQGERDMWRQVVTFIPPLPEPPVAPPSLPANATPAPSPQ